MSRYMVLILGKIVGKLRASRRYTGISGCGELRRRSLPESQDMRRGPSEKVQRDVGIGSAVVQRMTKYGHEITPPARSRYEASGE
ncbi:GL16669 [Drosophila persimilis]|uniref:GL16669 n=1 Tax=Drosophila persimilis TaxID=7234 RepID=B4HD80_DROPE|nr:GL16669 [Drosophila persimilis]